MLLSINIIWFNISQKTTRRCPSFLTKISNVTSSVAESGSQAIIYSVLYINRYFSFLRIFIDLEMVKMKIRHNLMNCTEKFQIIWFHNQKATYHHQNYVLQKMELCSCGETLLTLILNFLDKNLLFLTFLLINAL